MKLISRLFQTLVVTGLVLPSTACLAQSEANATIKCTDGFELDARVQLPENTKAKDVKRAIVLVHGSGSHSMDVDLRQVTRGHGENFVFRDISNALSASGFAVIRYNKRNYQIAQNAKVDADFMKSRIVSDFRDNPLRNFVDDVLAAVQFAKAEVPSAEIYLLGHSEGTYVSLQAASQSELIRGVALIGFAEYSTERLAFEQTVYRPLHSFVQLDQNGDDRLDKQELGADSPLAHSLLLGFAALDLDRDETLSKAEFQAANYANLLIEDTFGKFRKQEAVYPRVAEILKSAKFKVAFFQGLLDNQTLAYHAMAFDLLLHQMGKADEMRFHYFPGLGHALDPRTDMQDLEFSPIDPAALKTMVGELNTFFEIGPPANSAEQGEMTLAAQFLEQIAATRGRCASRDAHGENPRSLSPMK